MSYKQFSSKQDSIAAAQAAPAKDGAANKAVPPAQPAKPEPSPKA